MNRTYSKTHRYLIGNKSVFPTYVDHILSNQVIISPGTGSMGSQYCKSYPNSEGLEPIMESVSGELKCQLCPFFLTDKGRLDKMNILKHVGG